MFSQVIFLFMRNEQKQASSAPLSEFWATKALSKLNYQVNLVNKNLPLSQGYQVFWLEAEL